MKTRIEIVERTIPKSLADHAGLKLMWSKSLLLVAHANHLAAIITLHELVITTRPDCPARLACLSAATELLTFVEPWEQVAIFKDALYLLLPSWCPAIRTFARQVVLLHAEGRHEAANEALAHLNDIEAALRTFMPTLVSASARHVLAECKEFFECDPAVCRPTCTEEDVTALMKSSQ